MRNSWTSRSLLWLALALVAAPGCQVLHRYRPAPVLVRDAETKQPIPGVAVRISYPLSHSYLAPSESRGETGADGIVRLRTAPFGNAGTMVEVTAKGYLNEQKFLTAKDVEEIPTPGLFEDTSTRQPCLVMEMYSGPHPTIELVVPPAYRGMVKMRIRVKPDDAPTDTQQREFSFVVPDSGVAEISGPALFRHVNLSNIRFRASDGIRVTKGGAESMLGHWYVKTEDGYQYFLVGTAGDHDELRRNVIGRQIVDDGKGRWGRHKRQQDDVIDVGGVTTPTMFNRSAAESGMPLSMPMSLPTRGNQ
jgi:hypothetical protein